MKLKIKNIGTFKEAEILLDGITIIAGKNDTGKSTIGKIIFSLIKADNMAVARFKNWRIERIRENLKTIRHVIILKFPKEKDIVEKLLELEKKIIKEFEKKYRKETEETIFNEIKKYVLQFSSDEQIKNNLKELEKWIFSERAFIERRRIEFQSQIKFNFEGLIQLIDSEESYIELGNELYSVRIKENKCIYFRDKLPKDIRGRRERPFKDATLIETPIILNLTNFFNSIDKLEGEIKSQIKYPYMLRDVVKKLFLGKYHPEHEERIKNIVKFINELVNGEFTTTYGEVFFSRNNIEFPMVDTATGIKAFGIIYLLLKNMHIKDFSTFLIIDEPEVHLHPEWQIKYAKLLVEIHKQLGCLILVNSHSPYFIQGIRYFADKYGYIKNTHFYYSYKKDGVAKIELVDNKLTKIFDSLVEPLEETPI